MRLMNKVLRAFIGCFMVVYFDDILIYSKSLEEHLDHLRVVFNALRAAHLFGNLAKCTFCTDRVAFLGYVVKAQGIEVDPAKIEAISSWPQCTDPTPANMHHVYTLLLLLLLHFFKDITHTCQITMFSYIHQRKVLPFILYFIVRGEKARKALRFQEIRQCVGNVIKGPTCAEGQNIGRGSLQKKQMRQARRVRGAGRKR
jgi:hypothetical protein